LITHPAPARSKDQMAAARQRTVTTLRDAEA